jgi:hypothetical protein
MPLTQDERQGFQVAAMPAKLGKQERLDRLRVAVADLLNLALSLGLDVATAR